MFSSLKIFLGVEHGKKKILTLKKFKIYIIRSSIFFFQCCFQFHVIKSLKKIKPNHDSGLNSPKTWFKWFFKFLGDIITNLSIFKCDVSAYSKKLWYRSFRVTPWTNYFLRSSEEWDQTKIYTRFNCYNLWFCSEDLLKIFRRKRSHHHKISSKYFWVFWKIFN